MPSTRTRHRLRHVHTEVPESSGYQICCVGIEYGCDRNRCGVQTCSPQPRDMAHALSKCDLVFIIRHKQFAINRGDILLAIERIQIDADTAQFGVLHSDDPTQSAEWRLRHCERLRP